jgi:hypothetical protein
LAPHPGGTRADPLDHELGGAGRRDSVKRSLPEARPPRSSPWLSLHFLHGVRAAKVRHNLQPEPAGPAVQAGHGGRGQVRDAHGPGRGILACRMPLVGPTWVEVLKLRRRAAPAGRAKAKNMAGAGGARTCRRRSWQCTSDSNDLHTAQCSPAPLRLVSRERPAFRSRPPL